jgi:adenylate cyclase class 2
VTTKSDTALEVEIKIKIDSVYLEDLRVTIAKKGFQLLESRALEQNILFDTPDQVLKRNKFLLRLRKKNNKYIITFKRPPLSTSISETYKVREETEVEVSDFETVKKIFMGLGYEVVFIYEKYREVFQRGNIALMVDETPIGNFIEIEGPEEAIDRTAKELGYGKSDYITENYRTLFKKAGHSGHMVFGE